MNVIFIQVEFLTDRLIRKVEPHQIEAQDPFPKRLMVMGQNGVGHIVEVGVTSSAAIARSVTWPLVNAALPNIVGFTPGAFDPMGPATLANGFIAFRAIDQIVDSEHPGSMPRSDSLSKISELGSGTYSSQKQL